MHKLLTNIITRTKSPAFIRFKESSEKYIQENPGINLVRLDCLNPVKAIKTDFDFSYKPQINKLDAWTQYLQYQPKCYMYSLGVRHSLLDIFTILKFRNMTVTIPYDVYPVYSNILEQVGMPYNVYNTVPHFDIDKCFQSNVILITAPMMPLGRDLYNPEFRELVSWLDQDENRYIIIDRVYDYKQDNIFFNLVDKFPDQVIICYSLSKTFLQPLQYGFTILPKDIKDLISRYLPTYPTLDNDKILLTKYKDFPKEQQSRFRYRWNLLKPIIKDLDQWWRPPQIGYLSVIKSSYERSLKLGVMTVPGDVYNISNDYSVISCLHETNNYRETEEIKKYHVTMLSNFSKGYDKYSRTYSKKYIPESTFPNKFYLLDHNNISFGLEKTKRLINKLSNNDEPVILETTIKRHQLTIYDNIEQNWINITNIYDKNYKLVLPEEIYGKSLSMNKLIDWKDIKPRSLSVLPVAKACQARCDFCFSHSSISDEQKQSSQLLSVLDRICKISKIKGAERFVITGGGEPTMIKHEKMIEIVSIAKKYFDNITMITNGYILANDPENIKILQNITNSGLSTLAISCHSHDKNHLIMKIKTNSENIPLIIKQNNINLKVRWICVLQKGGVENTETLIKYLNWSVNTEVYEICFKELYVAISQESEYFNSKYNQWSLNHQIPLKLVIDFLVANGGNKIDELPWGSPIFLLCWNNKMLKIAVYTEPSVFWEKSNGICRSWNLLADGKCYANLETKDSFISV